MSAMQGLLNAIPINYAGQGSIVRHLCMFSNPLIPFIEITKEVMNVSVPQGFMPLLTIYLPVQSRLRPLWVVLFQI